MTVLHMVVVVDDSEADLYLARRAFERAGATYVHTTSDPRHARELLAEHRRLRTRHDLPPPLVVLDFRMPGMNADEMLRNGEDNSPTVILSAMPSSMVREQLLGIPGVIDVLEKPLTTEMVRALEQKLNGQRPDEVKHG